MQSTLISIVIAMLFVSGIVLAQSSSPPLAKVTNSQNSFDERFNLADKDGDHALSKEEARTAHMTGIEEHFEAIDADRDGKVTLSEYRAYLKRRVQARPMA